MATYAPFLVILMVLSPVLLPAAITAFHYLTGRAGTSTQERLAANFPRRTAAPRFAAAAA
jgi:hypothetical protein